MIKQEIQNLLLRKQKNASHGLKFLTSLSKYIQEDPDAAKFFVTKMENFQSYRYPFNLTCLWNTVDVFKLEYLKETQFESQIWLEFEFSIEKHYWIEKGLDINGNKVYKQINSFQPTGLSFYVQYFGENFNIRTKELKCMESNGFSFVIDQIATELTKQ